MTHMRNITTVLLLSALAGTGYAQTQKSPSEVLAELAAAQRSGDTVSGETGLKLNELNPQRYQTSVVASTMSREQVKAELVEAIRNGDILVGESGHTLAEQNPQRYGKATTRDAVDKTDFARRAVPSTAQ